MDGNVLDMECAMPVATRVAGSGRIAAGKLPATLAAVTTHVGPYDQLGRTWSNLKGVTYLTSQGRKRLYSVGSHVLSLPYERGSKDPSRARLFPRSWATRRKCIVTLVKYVSLIPMNRQQNKTDSGLAIWTRNLHRHFGGVHAVRGIDIAVAPGEIYGFLGPNGAGKTTTLRVLTTLLLPSAGRAAVSGFDVVSDAARVRLKIGAALQEVGLDPKQTGLELLRLQGYLYGLSRRESNRRIAELEHLIDIGDAIKRLIGTYSGGMKRRLDLAASLIHSPEILFLDEPTTGLDPISRARVWEHIRAVNRELGVTIFLTTQYLEEADALADRVGIIEEGVLAVEGTPRELKRDIGSDVIVASVDDPEKALKTLRSLPWAREIDTFGNELSVAAAEGSRQISEVALALAGAGVEVESLTLRTPTLDDVFLHVTGARISGPDPAAAARGPAGRQ